MPRRCGAMSITVWVRVCIPASSACWRCCERTPIPRPTSPVLALGRVREQDKFHLISKRTAGLVERYGPRSRLHSLSDHMKVAMVPIPSDPVPWGDADDLERRLGVPPLPWSSGLPPVDLYRLWSACSNPCKHKMCSLVTTVNNMRTTSVSRCCCAADLKP